MIERLIFPKLLEEISQPEIVILLGPRQVGKTTLLRQVAQFAKKQGLPATLYDLEQPDVLAAFNVPDRDIIAKLANSKSLVLIDEFQYLQNASKVLKAIYDSGQKLKIFCSGSSSLEIHKHLKESLAGRRLLFQIYPLSFAELSRSRRGFSTNDYLVYGGMPGLTHTEELERKKQLLADLLSSYILKDVKALVREENLRAFNHLLYLLAERQGSAVSVQSLAGQVSMSHKAVSRYLDILEGTYVNYRIYSYSQNLGNELKKSCKTYLYDLGIRNAILKDFSPPAKRQDRGVLYETFVFLRLQQFAGPDTEIKFWRTKDGDEVDFILVRNRKPLPVEVKGKLAGPQIPKGMTRFLLRYPDTPKALVVNDGLAATAHYHATRVEFIPLQEFALKWTPQAED